MSDYDEAEEPSRPPRPQGGDPGASEPYEPFEDELAYVDSLDTDASGAEGSAVPKAAVAPETARPRATAVPELLGVEQRLDPDYVPAARLVGALTSLFLFGAALFGILIYWFASEQALWTKLAIAGGVTLIPLAAAILGYAWPPLEYRRTRWCVGEEGVEIKRGVVYRHIIFVPRTRIQHTDVSQGPIQRRFDLASFSVHTAGSHQPEITLDGVTHATALALRDHLLDSGVGDGA